MSRREDPERAARRARLQAFVMRYGRTAYHELLRRHRGDHERFARAIAAALALAVEQDVRAQRDRDELTVLECAYGCRATKRITALTPDGVEDYAAGTWYATAPLEVVGFAGLVAELEDLQRRSRRFVIRGRLIAGRHPGRVRRLIYPDKKTGDKPYFEAVPRLWLAVDLDSFPLPAGVSPVDVLAVAVAGRRLLPPEFQRATCWVQLTSGAGIKGGGRCRAWFWLSRPLGDAEAKRWLKSSSVDHSLYVANTPHYVAAPLIAEGVVDPVPVRSAVLPGEAHVVAVPPLPEPPPRPKPNAAAARAYVAPDRGLHFRATRPESYMLRSLEALSAAPAGQGRDQCMRVALTLYGLAQAGRLDRNDVTARIKRVMHDRGWAADETTRGDTLTDINRLLRWAWDHATPRTLS